MSTREKIIDATCALIELQGSSATGLNQIVEESGAPKGSLYYHFPDGKEEIIEQAVLHASQRTATRIRQGLGSEKHLAKALKEFVETISHHVERSNYETGGPLTTVAMETAVGQPRINSACRQGYSKLQEAFEQAVLEAGLKAKRASELATFITASIEGGIILSRTYHTGEPLRRVAQELYQVLAWELKTAD